MVSWIDQYHFYEREWDNYEQLRESFEWEIPEKLNMAEYVCDRWTRERGRVAFFAEDESGDRRTVTFRDVQHGANRLANYLSAEGVAAGDRIGICLGQRPEAAVAHIAAWKLGTVSVPLSTQFGDDALGYRLDDCRATACIVGDSSAETLRSIRDDLDALETVVTVDTEPTETETSWDALETRASRQFDKTATNADDDAIIIYTSGTTGDPKGVLHAHRLLLGHLPTFAEAFIDRGTTDGTVFWTPVEWSWIGSLFTLVMPALYYGRPVVAHDADRFERRIGVRTPRAVRGDGLRGAADGPADDDATRRSGGPVRSGVRPPRRCGRRKRRRLGGRYVRRGASRRTLRADRSESRHRRL